MARTTQPLFLARDSYRRRRLADAARVLPVLGFILMVLPGMLTSTTVALVYVFTVWAILILIMIVLSRRLSRQDFEDTGEDVAGDAADP